MISLFDSRRKIVSLILTVITVMVAVFVVSYQVVYKFARTSDSVYYGKSQASVAAQLRDEITKRPDCQLISFKNSDGLLLQGFLFLRPRATATMLCCHGYKGSKEFLYAFLDLFPNFNLLLFDFRASGESEGDFITLGYHEYKDVLAGAEFLKAHTPRDIPFYILGFSMGGGATLRAGARTPGLADAYIIDSSFSDLRSMFLRGYSLRVGLPYYPFFPVIQAMFHYFADCNIDEVNSVAAVKKITEPIMFIHSCDDNFITPDHSIRLYASAQNELSKVWIGPHARHGFLHTYYPALYQRKTLSFLRDVRNAAPQSPLSDQP
jgi:uncharacterized protein